MGYIYIYIYIYIYAQYIECGQSLPPQLKCGAEASMLWAESVGIGLVSLPIPNHFFYHHIIWRIFMFNTNFCRMFWGVARENRSITYKYRVIHGRSDGREKHGRSIPGTWGVVTARWKKLDVWTVSNRLFHVISKFLPHRASHCLSRLEAPSSTVQTPTSFAAFWNWLAACNIMRGPSICKA